MFKVGDKVRFQEPGETDVHYGIVAEAEEPLYEGGGQELKVTFDDGVTEEIHSSEVTKAK